MKEQIIIVLILAAILCYVFYPKNNHQELEFYQSEPTYYEVSITGEVLFPGTYRFYEPKRLSDILKIAGLININLFDNQLMLDEIIYENQTIYVPKDEKKDNELININTATLNELQKIPGIGQAIAAAIISYREQNGAFSSFDDLLNVKYIGVSTLEKIRPYIKIN